MAGDPMTYCLKNKKQKIISDFITQFIGHEPSKEEKKRFTITHQLNETRIYCKGILIARMRYYLKDETLFAEYLSL